MRVFNWTFLLRAALAIPVAGLIGATVSTLTTGTTIASTKLNCAASDWRPRGFCGRNSAYCAAVCADPYNHASTGNWYSSEAGNGSSGGGQPPRGGSRSSSESSGQSSRGTTSGVSGGTSGDTSGGSSSGTSGADQRG